MFYRLHLRRRLLAGIVAASLMLVGLAAPTPVQAAPPSTHSTLLLASSDDSFSIRKFLSGFNRRDRVVQLCVGTMCLALLILCKKFSAEPLRENPLK
jgi:hypothetical protein